MVLLCLPSLGFLILVVRSSSTSFGWCCFLLFLVGRVVSKLFLLLCGVACFFPSLGGATVSLSRACGAAFSSPFLCEVLLSAASWAWRCHSFFLTCHEINVFEVTSGSCFTSFLDWCCVIPLYCGWCCFSFLFLLFSVVFLRLLGAVLPFIFLT